MKKAKDINGVRELIDIIKELIVKKLENEAEDFIEDIDFEKAYKAIEKRIERCKERRRKRLGQ